MSLVRPSRGTWASSSSTYATSNSATSTPITADACARSARRSAAIEWMPRSERLDVKTCAQRERPRRPQATCRATLSVRLSA
eukprot:2530034-Prymnesium_polylepis.1